MKTILALVIATVGLALAAADADAAKRFGGGGNLGKQRSAPTAPAARDATTTPASPTAAPAKPAQPAAAPTAPQPQPSFMGRWGGLLAGLGIGALLATLFGAQMGPIVGLVLAALAAFLVVGLLARFFMARAAPASATATTGRAQFPGIGSGLGAPAEAQRIEPVIGGGPSTPQRAIPAADVDAFLRVAKTSFLRMQAANDAGDLDDIRDYTTPEVYAEIAMQVEERGGTPQKTEVVDLKAELLDDAIEGDYAWASVRFSGAMREAPGAAPEPFDEVWNVRKNLRERNPAWLIAGIQQFPLAA